VIPIALARDVRAWNTHVIRHQRTRHGFAGIEPAVIEWNELHHWRAPSLDAHPFQHSCVQAQ
jgi:hypothetical protein